MIPLGSGVAWSMTRGPGVLDGSCRSGTLGEPGALSREGWSLGNSTGSAAACYGSEMYPWKNPE